MHNHHCHQLGVVLPLMLAAIPAAFAQTSAPSAATTALPTSQVFTNYRPFTVQPITPWPAANATVEKIGGWRTYARETAEPIAPPKSSSAPPPQAEPKP